MEQLTQQEETVMRHLWTMADGTVKDIVAKFEETAPPYTTVASVVKNLERKGYVRARRVGNTFLYTAAIAQTDYKRQRLRRLVSQYFNNSYKEMVSFFVEDRNISVKELAEIVHLIEHEEKP